MKIELQKINANLKKSHYAHNKIFENNNSLNQILIEDSNIDEEEFRLDFNKDINDIEEESDFDENIEEESDFDGDIEEESDFDGDIEEESDFDEDIEEESDFDEDIDEELDFDEERY